MSRLLTIIILFAVFPAIAEEIPEAVKPVISATVKLSAKDDYQGAIQLIKKSQTEAKDLQPIEHIIFGNLLINQYLNLMEWDEAEAQLIDLAKKFPDTQLSAGLFDFGQRAGAKSILRQLNEFDQSSRAISFAQRLLHVNPSWEKTIDHTLAPFWSAYADALFQQKQTEAAIEKWQKAKQSWASKSQLWKAHDEEQFKKYQGLDRFNPLEVKVEAKLVAAYFQAGRTEELLEIIQNWSLQHAVIRVAHDDDVAKSFRSSVRASMKSAGKLIAVSDFDLRFKINEDMSTDCNKQLTK